MYLVAEGQGFEPWEGLHPQRFSRTAHRYPTVVMGVKYSMKYRLLASWFVILCQHFQKKPRHSLVTAKLSVVTNAAENWKVQRQPKLAPCPSNSVITYQALNLQLVRLAILAKALKRRDSRWLKILFPQISNSQARR